ncbi:putative sulfate exporter family transporter, partial [Clostridium sp. HCS.1]|uniref:putative sulfate exporter family transporter n=1 Tax=Clostridium sp. HCS.1 TaxID=3238594 RepID=UPI003A0FD6C1
MLLQITLTIITTYWIGRKLKYNEKYCLLIASGNAVCGSSAIGATSPDVNASDSDKVISITIIN